jgi:hypothetical protein
MLSYFFMIHFNITLPSMSGSSELSASFRFLYLNPVCSFLLHHTRHMVRPTHYPWFDHSNDIWCRSRWLCGLRRRPAAAWCLGSQVRIPLTACTLISCVCSVLCRQRCVRRADHSTRGVLPGVCLIVCGLETSTMRRPRPDLGCCSTEKKMVRSITHEAHHKIFSSIFLLLFSSETNTSSSSPCSRTPSAYVLPNVTDLRLHPYRTISKITRLIMWNGPTNALVCQSTYLSTQYNMQNKWTYAAS